MRRLGTKDGVEAMARMGREERKGAWSAGRICTEAGRRSALDWLAEERLCGLVVGVMLEAAEGGRTGAVTDRLELMPTGNCAGVGVREDWRRETIVEASPCCA